MTLLAINQRLPGDGGMNGYACHVHTAACRVKSVQEMMQSKLWAMTALPVLRGWQGKGEFFGDHQGGPSRLLPG